MNTDDGLAYESVSKTIDIRANNVANNEYSCFGFDLKNDSVLDRVIGFSFSYEVYELIELLGSGSSPVFKDDYEYAIFLYETSLPYSSWN